MYFKDNLSPRSAEVHSHFKALLTLHRSISLKKIQFSHHVDLMDLSNNSDSPIKFNDDSKNKKSRLLSGLEIAWNDFARITRIVKSHPASSRLKEYSDPIFSTHHNILWFGR
jgi:hypothetical protein